MLVRPLVRMQTWAGASAVPAQMRAGVSPFSPCADVATNGAQVHGHVGAAPVRDAPLAADLLCATRERFRAPRQDALGLYTYSIYTYMYIYM